MASYRVAKAVPQEERLVPNHLTLLIQVYLDQQSLPTRDSLTLSIWQCRLPLEQCTFRPKLILMPAR